MTEKKCQKKCKLDQNKLVCLGCGRTLQEIIDAGNAQGKNGTEEKAALPLVPLNRRAAHSS
jgi:predicted Fe-S protein YdhL (DUF1289 family)